MPPRPTSSSSLQITPGITVQPSPWLVVFDLDGTLIDSSLDLCLAVNAAMAHVEAPQLPHELIAGYIGDGAATLVKRALDHERDPDCASEPAGSERSRFERAFEYFLGFYREHKLDNTRVYEGVPAALESIRSQYPDLLMAVLTNKPVRPSQEICEALGLAPFFFKNYGGDSFPTKKPDPLGLQTLMAEARKLLQSTSRAPADLEPYGVLMIGDSEADVQAGRRAGTRTLGCRYGLAPQRLQLAAPDQMCDSPLEWPALLAFGR